METNRFGDVIDVSSGMSNFPTTNRFGDQIEDDKSSKPGVPFGKQLIENYARPVLQGVGSAAGVVVGGGAGVAGGPAAPATVTAGAIIGGGIGFAIGDELADMLSQWFGYNEVKPMMLELQETAEDVATGLTGEMGGHSAVPAAKLAGKGIMKIPGISQAIEGMGTYAKAGYQRMKDLATSMPMSQKGAEKKAGEIMALNTPQGPLIMENIEQARAIEEAIGVKFDLAQLTGDEGVIKFVNNSGMSPGDFAVMQAERTAFNTKKINDFIKKSKGAGTAEDLMDPLAKREQIANEAADIARMNLEDAATAKVSKVSPMEGGKTIGKELQAGEKAARDKAGKLFDLVPDQNMKVDDLVDEFDSILKPSYPDESSKKFPDVVKRTITRLRDSVKSKTGVPLVTKDPKTGKFVTAKAKPKDMTMSLKDLQGLRSEILEDLRTAVDKGYPRSLRARLGKAVEAIDKKLVGDASKELAPLRRRIAIKHPKTGKIITGGPSHIDVMEPQGLTYDDFPGKKYDTDMGYITKDGKYLDRDQAKALYGSGEASQLTSDTSPLRTAQKFFKEEVIDKYHKGSVGDVMSGPDAVQDAMISGKFFKSGPAGEQAASEFMSIMGNNPAAKGALKDYVNQSMLDAAVSPKTGEITQGSLNRWLKSHHLALDKLGMKDDFNSLVKARQAVDEALVGKKAFDKSVASQVLNADVDDVVKKAFAKGSKKEAAKDLMRNLKGDTKAVAGLQNAIVDRMLTEIPLGTTSDIGKLLTSKQMAVNLRKYDAAIKVVFKDSPEKLKAMYQVRSAMKTLERGVGIPKKGVDRAENLLTYLARRHGFSRSAVVNVVQAALGPLKRFSDKQVNGLVNKAIIDPDFAYGLIYATRGGKPEKATKLIIQNLTKAGLMTSGNEE